MASKTWQPGDDKPRAPRAAKKRDVELHDAEPVAPPAAPHRPNWRAPDGWREAAMAAERGEINNAAEAQKILDMLNGITWDKPTVARAVVQPKPMPPPPAPPPPPVAQAAPPAPAQGAQDTEYREDCDCVVLNLGQGADRDCPKCGGTGYTRS